MFRTSAPVEQQRQSSSRKWIRRLTGASSRSSESGSKDGSPGKPTKLKSRSSKQQRSAAPGLTVSSPTTTVFPSAANLRSRPNIILPKPAKGYVSTRRPVTPRTAEARAQKRSSRRPVTPKRNSVGAPSIKSVRKPQDRRPGSSKSARSTRSQSLRTTRRDFEEVASVKSSASDAPAYLSCLDDYLYRDSIVPSAPTRKEPPHVLYINTFASAAASRPVSPALPSATSWTLEKSLDDLWCWRDGRTDDPVQSLSEARTSLSDGTLADSEGVVDEIGAEKKADEVQIDVTEVSDDSPELKTMPSLTSIKPLNIARPTLSLDVPRPRPERQGSAASSLVSPSSTLVSSPIVDMTHHKQDVWVTVSALRSFWEDGEEDVLTFIRRPSIDDSDDALLSFRRLNIRQKQLGNYI